MVNISAFIIAINSVWIFMGGGVATVLPGPLEWPSEALSSLSDRTEEQLNIAVRNFWPGGGGARL